MDTASRHRVQAVFGGHQHIDEVEGVPWEDGGGETIYSCQTCVYFDEGGESDHYPGYRLVEVEDGDIISFAYLDGTSSYPFYDGSIPGGITDLDELDLRALDARVLKTMQEGKTHIVVEVESYLATTMDLAGIVVQAPASPAGDYTIEGGELYRSVEVPGKPGWVLLYVRTEVGPGRPGTTAEIPGEASHKTITISN